MNSTGSTNIQLVDTLVQIILSLSDSERDLLASKVQDLTALGSTPEQQRARLREDLQLGLDQIWQGNFTDYDDSSLPDLVNSIRQRGREKLYVDQKQ